MAGGPLSEFFIRLGVKVDKGELKKIDSLLKSIEKRLGSVGKAQVAEANATDTATKATKRKTKAEKEQEKAVKDANTVAAHQLGLRQKWLKQQDKIADSAKKVHDFQMKLMRQAQGVANAGAKQDVKNLEMVTRAVAKNSAAWRQQFRSSVSGLTSKPSSGRALKEQQKLYDNLFGATAKGQPFKNLSAKQIGANRRAFFNSTRGIEVRSGYNSQYRLGEQQAENAAKVAAERVAAEKEANRKIEQERKSHADRLARMENARLIHQRAMERVYGSEAAKRRLAEQAQQNFLERQRVRQQQLESRGNRSPASYSRSNFLHAGGAGGAIARYGFGAIPFVGGAYGLASLNQANQSQVSANIAAESVLGSRADELLNRLSERSNYLGISYADTLPQYTKFLASASPLLGQDQSSEIFDSFLQFGRTRGADKVSLNRALTAVAQIAAKGQVMSEELKGQLGDAAGFGELPQLFAEALQIKRGGNLTGADARAYLMDEMQKGNVKSADVLPIVSRLLNDLSSGGIEVARRSSGAEQARAENALLGRGGLLEVFSKNGGESGFARFFNGINSQLSQSKPLAEGFARAFENSATQAQKLLTFAESFNNAIEGKDSQVADWLGAEKTAQLRSDWTEIKGLLDQIFSQGSPAWLPTMEDITNRLSGVLRTIAEISQFRSSTGGAIVDAYKTEGVFSAGALAIKSGAVIAGKGLGAGYQSVAETIPFALNHPAINGAYNLAGDLANMESNRYASEYWKSKSNRLGSLEGAQAALQNGSQLINPSQDDALTALLQNGRGGGANQQQITYDNQIELNVTVTGGQEAENWARNTFSRLVEESMTAFPSR